MIDINTLEYTLKVRGITKDALIKAQGWSLTTYYRKMNSKSDWSIGEVNTLVGLGLDLTEIIGIFFK